jgi:hypothetical protein
MPREKKNKNDEDKSEQKDENKSEREDEEQETKREDKIERKQITESTKLISNKNENGTKNPNSVFNVDQITMECFMNKNAYQKIIAKTNPLLFLENTRFQQQKKKYKTKILERTRQLLSPTFCETNEVRSMIQESFDLYVKQVIQEFELQKYEMKRENEDDEDILFGNCVSEQVFSDDESNDSYESNKNSETNEKCGMALEKAHESCSFWSKDKVVKGK